jgi:SAM-dependent methyltransferase
MAWLWRLTVDERRTLRRRVRRLTHPVWMGTLRRTAPVSDLWGYDRGRPVDRYYIERFLAEHRADIRGRVLEVKDRRYTEQFGVGVTRSDVLDLDDANKDATLVADLSVGDTLEPDVFDCCIVTQTLHCIHDIHAAVRQLHRILRPGGVLLATLPTVSRIDTEGPADHWRLTPAACAQLFGAVFGAERVSVSGHGNVLASIASLTGVAQDELSQTELNYQDARFPVVVAVRAAKSLPDGHR